nr:MAG TPA: hypothetical protein [Caudoviricetes sp.]
MTFPPTLSVPLDQIRTRTMIARFLRGLDLEQD